MAITEPAQFTTEKKKQTYKPVVFINFDTPGKYWASRFIDVSQDVASSANWSDGAGADYEDRLEDGGIGGVSQSVARFGGLASLGGVTVKLTNLGYADFLATYPYLEGQEISIYLVFDDGTPLVFAESLKVFTGLVETFGVDEGSLTVTISPPEIIGELELPVNATDGELDQVVYGEHSYNKNELSSTLIYMKDAQNMPKCRLINTNILYTGETVYTYQISGNELHTMSSANFWLKDGNNGRFYSLLATGITISVTNNSSGAYVEITVPASGIVTAYDYIYPIAHDARLPIGFTPWTKILEIYDRLDTTLGYVEKTASTFISGVNLFFPVVEYGDVTLTGAPTVLSRTITTSSDPTNLTFDINGVDAKASSSTSYSTKGTTTNVEDLVSIDVQNLIDATTIKCEVAQVFKRAPLSIVFDPNDFELYAGCKGQKDDGSGTYTNSAGSLLQNPVHILHHLAINYFDKSTSELTTEITNPVSVLAAARSSWEFSKIYSESEKYKDIVNNFAQRALLLAWINNENKLTGKAILTASSEKFPNSGATAANSADMATDTPAIAAGSIAKHWLKEVKTTNKTNIKDWGNDITLEYFIDPYEDKYQIKDLNATDSNSITEYGQTKTRIIQNDYIVSDTTAGYYLDLYLELAAYRTFYATGFGRLDLVNYEPGDLIDLYFVWDGVLSAEDRIWQILDITKTVLDGVGTVKFKAVERLRL